MKSKSVISIIISFVIGMEMASAITGRVVGKESGLPLEFVNVVAYDADSLYLGGCTTDSLGRFDIAQPEARTVSFMLMGYKPLTVDVTTQGDKMGDVMMEQDAVQLGEVTVTDVRPETRLQGNSFITTVSNTFLSTLVSTSDMLKWIPGLSVNDRQIKVFQKSNPLIYINNRKINDFNDIEMLEPANIASVEVIPDPGVKYGVGVDCVVIIRTKKNLSDKLGLSLYSGNTMATYYSNNENLNFTYRNKGLEIVAAGYYSYNHTKYAGEVGYEAFGSVPWKRQSIQSNASHSHGGGANLGVSYDFSPSQSVGIYYIFNGKDQSTSQTETNVMTIGQQEAENRATYSEYDYKTLPNNSLNIYYNGTFGNLNIDFNADWYSNKNTSGLAALEHSDTNQDYEVHTEIENKSRMLAEKLVATINLNGLRIMFGEEFTNTRLESTSSNLEQIIANNSSISKESIISAFAELSKRFGRFSASAGIRFEHTDATYSYSQTTTTDETRSLNDWFPTVNINGALGNVELSLNYDSRFLRPSYSQLDATIGYIDLYTLKQGNPLLKSVGRHSVTAYAKWKNLWARLSYRVRNNPIAEYYKPYNADGTILIYTSENLDRQQFLNAVVGGNFSLGPWYCSGNVEFGRQWFNAPFQGNMINMNGNIFGMQFNNYLSLPWNIKLNVMYWIYSGYEYDNRHFDLTHSLSAALSTSFFNNTLQVELGGRDLLQTAYNTRIAYADFLRTTSQYTGDRRTFYLNLRYNFNAKQSRYKGKGAGDSEKSRL